MGGATLPCRLPIGSLMGNPAYEITQGRILLDGEDLTEADPDDRAKAGLFMAFQYPVSIPGVWLGIANGTAYGLAAAICTTDLVRADRLARRLEAGMVFVNNYMRRAFLGSPFGGVKGSGFGRENALETLHEFVRSKNVRFPSGRGVVPVWPPGDS